ncbi:Nicotianamine synthase [Pyrenochaeta sp. DS3sAY3a]|nr:Nicotianamine synthase [Pyrenochaeta sp. DS3sAY3a]
MAATTKTPPCTFSSVQTPPTTPTTATMSAHQILSEIQSIYRTLSSLESLAPSVPVNTLLTRLVNLCVVPYSETLSSYFFAISGVEDLCVKLRPICSQAEGELERYWADRIVEIANGTTTPTLSKKELLDLFPYYQNYIDLSRLECSTIEAYLPTSPRRIAFIGSGPLPLTSLCMLDRYPNASAHNIDRDISALRVSQRLCETLGYGQRMTFACADASTEEERPFHWESLEVVFLAALVGMETSTKLSILASLSRKLKPGTLVIARSARGLRGVLYPILELSDDITQSGFDILAEVHPWTKVVNSVIVLKVKERL